MLPPLRTLLPEQSLILLFFCSGRWSSLANNETTQCPNAGRIPSPEQDSFPSKPSRKCHEGTTQRPVFTVAFEFTYFSSICLHFCILQLRYPNLYEVRLIPTKKDIAFVEYMDEVSATVAKEALHNFKLDGENKIKVHLPFFCITLQQDSNMKTLDYLREKIKRFCIFCVARRLFVALCECIKHFCLNTA